MDTPIARFKALLGSLGEPDELRASADETSELGKRRRVNAHVHLPPNFSAFSSAVQAVDLARNQGVEVLGASNYYDYSIYEDFANQASERGVFPLFGTEIIALLQDLVDARVKVNDPGNFGKMYICGKAITRFSPLSDDALGLLNVIRTQDGKRNAEVIARLATLFAEAGLETGLDAEAIRRGVAERFGRPVESIYLQERHICQAFQEALFEQLSETDRAATLARLFGGPSASDPTDAVAVQNEIRSRLMKAGKPAFVPDTFVDFQHAYRLILALGGIPSYPILIDGVTPLCGFEESPDRLVAALRERGIHAAEFIPNRNSPELLRRYAHALRDAGIVVTAGTEHNTQELLAIEPVCAGGAPVPPDVQELFWEGACVLAAHEYLSLMGETGYVNSAGKVHGGSILEHARLGAVLIGRFADLTA